MRGLAIIDTGSPGTIRKRKKLKVSTAAKVIRLKAILRMI
jgi:hypothetical protein